MSWPALVVALLGAATAAYQTVAFLQTGSGMWDFPLWFEVVAGLSLGAIVFAVVWGLDLLIRKLIGG